MASSSSTSTCLGTEPKRLKTNRTQRGAALEKPTKERKNTQKYDVGSPSSLVLIQVAQVLSFARFPFSHEIFFFFFPFVPMGEKKKRSVIGSHVITDWNHLSINPVRRRNGWSPFVTD
jgi:hypothetical protein